MFRLLQTIFAAPFAYQLAFKGGTLAYFMYGLDRFSTDIDIDYIAGGDIPGGLIEEIIQLCAPLGDIKKNYIHAKSCRLIFRYHLGEHNIKIEINARNSPHNIYEVINMRGITLKAQDKATMFANKLIALTHRVSPVARDLWDVYFFAKSGFPLNKNVVLERILEDGKYPEITTFDGYIQFVIIYIQKVFHQKVVVDANLGLVLDMKQKDRARKSLVQETITYLSLMI